MNLLYTNKKASAKPTSKQAGRPKLSSDSLQRKLKFEMAKTELAWRFSLKKTELPNANTRLSKDLLKQSICGVRCEFKYTSKN